MASRGTALTGDRLAEYFFPPMKTGDIKIQH